MISVCLATYNGEKYLRQQIDSILSQLEQGDELVVSDDGSKDSTLEILRSYNDTRIKVLHNQSIHGVNGNFENALIHAKGDIIFLSDQDDVWISGKVEACVNALKDCECVVHDAIVVNMNLEVKNPSFFTERKSGPGFWKNIYKNTYLGCGMAFKREVLNVCLPIPKTTAYFHDNWIGCIADLKFRLRFIPFKGIYFRRHSDNTSCTAKKSGFSFSKQFLNRVEQVVDVVKRVVFKL